ncbi:MAG: hypothetical protein WCK32_08730 [Chlorobiaceae bacterium]
MSILNQMEDHCHEKSQFSEKQIGYALKQEKNSDRVKDDVSPKKWSTWL